MKRIFLFMMAMFATVSYTYAQDNDKIYFNDVVIPQGGSATLIVNLKSAERSYAGLQCDFTLPTGVKATKITSANRISSVLDPSTDKEAFYVKYADNTTFYRVLIYNDIKASIPGTDGEIAYITVTANADATLGDYVCDLKGITMTTADKQEFSSADASFKVTITDRQILDENSTTAPAAAENVKVKVLRTIKAGNWSTICLPFAMTGDQLVEAFGDAEYADFNGYEKEEDGDGNTIGIRVKFNSFDASSGLAANHPCIIKVKNNVSDFIADNVTIEPEDEPTVAAVKRTKKQWSELIGTYVANTVVGNAEEESWMLYLANNKFYYSKGTARMKAFRAYFDFYDVLADFENAAKIGFYVDGDATSIDGIGTQRVVEGVYDLSGRKIQLQDGDLNKLQKGVYIIDGKKVTIK